MMTIDMIRGRIILIKDTPEALIAKSSNLSLKFPKVINDARRMARALTNAGVRNQYYVGKNLFNSGHCYVKRIPLAPARKGMLKIMTWYKDEMLMLGADMTEGHARVEKFLTNYHKALKGKIEC